MDTIASLFPGPLPPSRTTFNTGIHEGRFSRAPASQFVGAYFKLDSFDDGVNEFGPCPWHVRSIEYSQPDGIVTQHLFPAVGDRCFVAFIGEGNDPIIVGWWPIGRGFQETRV